MNKNSPVYNQLLEIHHNAIRQAWGHGVPATKSQKLKSCLDWEDWLNRKHLTLDDALLLAMGQNPVEFDMFDTELFWDEYQELFNKAKGWINGDELKVKAILTDDGSSEYREIVPYDFFMLAKANNWFLPEAVHNWLDNQQKLSCTSEPITTLAGVSVIPESLKGNLANYESWRKADLWTIELAILLLVNAETLPGNNYYSSGRCDSDQEQAIYDKFMEIWKIAEGSLIAGTLTKVGKSSASLSSMVKPVDFIKWARLKGLEIPAELNNFGNPIELKLQANKERTPIQDYRECLISGEGLPWQLAKNLSAIRSWPLDSGEFYYAEKEYRNTIEQAWRSGNIQDTLFKVNKIPSFFTQR